MLRKLLVVVLLFGVAFSLQAAKTPKVKTPSMARESTEISPTAGRHKVVLKFSQIEENLGDSIWAFDVQSQVSDNQILGLEFDGTYFWVTGGNSGNDPNKLYQFDANGNYIATYDQPSQCSGWGWRDMTWDGQYLYASCSNIIHQIDPATGQPTGETINGPENPNRALAYDPETDHFFTANFSSNIYEFDRSGNVINVWGNSYSIYGMAWDNVSEGGPYLWVAAQEDNGVGGQNVIYQFDPAAGTYTGVYFPVTAGDPQAVAGGLAFTTEWDPAMGILFEVEQATSDMVIGFYVCEALKDYLILDLDPTTITGPWLDSLFTSIGLDGTYTTDPSYFDSLANYKSLWLLVGMYPNNTHIEPDQGSKIEDFLNNGGKLYLEGGDVFYYDPSTGFWDPNPFTGTLALSDGGNDLDTIIGVANDFLPWVENNIWTYGGENSWVDQLIADTLPPNGGVAQEVFMDINNSYYTGVAYDQGTWRTFAISSELGGYEGDIPKDSIAIWIWNFLRYGPPQHDVGAVTVLEPSSPQPVGSAITPAVLIRNFGDFAESNFDVTMDIYLNGSLVYTNTQTVTATLNPGDTTTVTFDQWTPSDAGTYDIIAYTQLAGDMDPSNDTTTSSFMAFAFVKDYLVLDMDETPISGSAIHGFLMSHGLTGDYVVNDPSYFDSLLFYQSIWICLGMYPNNYVLSSDQVEKIRVYLSAGGNAYIEGGDCWGFDATRPILDSLFGIDYSCTNDGEADLTTVAGQDNTLIPNVAGHTWNYGGENNWVDELCLFSTPPYGGTAEVYLKNATEGDNVGVVYDQGTWKTVAHSFEIGGLTPGTATMEELLLWIAAQHFEIIGVEEEKVAPNVFALYNATPNPARGNVTITFSLPRRLNVSLKVYDATGRYVTTLLKGTYEAGIHKVTWNGRDSAGRKVAQGIYFYKLEAGKYRATKKVVILR